METCFTLSRPDGQALAGYIWARAAKPRAVLVVSHGMGEHARRYRPALAKLIDSGIAIYALDQRGHGETIALSGLEPGDYGPGGFAAVVEDLAALVERARQDHPGTPVGLLGHSMGSVSGQAFLLDHADKLDAAVLVGTTAVDLLAAAMAQATDAMAGLNSPFEPARTPCDWLSRDEAQVDAYIADPFCGFSLVPTSMIDLLSQAGRLADPAQLSRIPPTLPLYILVGDCDVLTTHFGALQPLVDRYVAAGLTPVVAQYPGGRHEILNEINRDEVVDDLLVWLDQTLDAPPRLRL